MNFSRSGARRRRRTPDPPAPDARFPAWDTSGFDPGCRMVIQGCHITGPGDCSPLTEAGFDGVHIQAGGWIIPGGGKSSIMLREGTVIRALPDGGFVIENISVSDAHLAEFGRAPGGAG